MGKTEETAAQEAGNREHIWCTSCGRILPGGSVYCEFCGARVEHEIDRASEDDKQQSGQQNRHFNDNGIEYQDGEGSVGFLRRPGWKKAGAAGAIAACGLALYFFMGAAGEGSGEGGQPILGYIKDNSLFVLEEDGDSREISEICLRDWKNREQLRLPEAADWLPFYSEGEEILWYPEQAGDGAFSLMSLHNKKEQKADGSAVSVQTAGETAAYEKSSGGLYVYAGGRKQKLAAAVSYYQLGTKGDYLIWQEEHPDQTTGLYGASLDKEGQAEEEELLERDAELLGASGDLTSILYKKEGEIWLLENHSKKRRLAQDVNQVFLTGRDEKRLFFTRKENGGERLYVLNGKQEAGGETERLLDPEFLFLIHEEDGILTYKAAGEDGEEIRIAGPEAYAALDCAPDEEISFTVSGGCGWYLASPEPGMEQALYRVSLDAEQFGSTEEAAERADSFCGQYEGIPFCLKDVNDKTGDLYFGEQAVSYDVKTDSVHLERSGSGEETGVCFLADYDAQSGSGVLMRYSGGDGQAEEIDGGVSGYLAAPDELLYFTDYDPARGRGTLNRYKDGKSEEIGADIWAAYGRRGDAAVFARQNQSCEIE